MRIRLLAMADQGIDREALKQHKEITDAILAKDWERLHTILNFHLNRLVNQERALLSKYPDLFEREKCGGEKGAGRAGRGFPGGDKT